MSRSFFSRLKDSFLRRWRVGYEHEPYLPRTQYEQRTSNHLIDQAPYIYRFPSPASQEKGSVPLGPEETVYDTAFYKRNQIKLRPPPGADPKEFHFYADPSTLGEFEEPRHLPQPWWMYDRNALKYIRKVYKESGGIIRSGVYKDKQFLQLGWNKEQFAEDAKVHGQ